MDHPLAPAAAAGGCILGTLSWALYWRRGEHHLWTLQYLQMAAIWPIIGAILGGAFLDSAWGVALVADAGGSDHRLHSWSRWLIGTAKRDQNVVSAWDAQHHSTRIQALKLSLLAQGLYVLTVWSCMLTYRAFFHRLHAFPGPFSWKLSKFVQAFQNRKFENYKIVDKLHKKHGEYVRTGPTELSIVDPDAAAAILSTQSRCMRGPWYEMGRPLKSMLETRERKQHDSRRRVWDRGFGARALRDYEPRVEKYVKILMERLADFKGEPLNVSKWFNYFSFDVMGDLAFAHSFEMLETGKRHEVLDMLEKGQQPLGFLGMLPWLFNFLTKVPGVSADYNNWLAYCKDLIVERQKMKVDRPDIAHWLLDYQAAGHDSDGPAEDLEWLRGDSRLVVVAGSDTTAAGLSFCFYHLCHAPQHVAAIRSELAALTRTESDSFDARALQNDCPYLNAFINETLRLHPPVPGGFQRQTPPEGLLLTRSEDAPGPREIYLPGGINVWMPLWTLARSPRCFTHPEDFDPRRFLPDSHPDSPAAYPAAEDRPRILRREAFLPFSSGPLGCVGKQLALQEMRLVIASILDRFEPRLGPGEDGTALLVDSRDWFTLGLGALQVSFHKRKD